jgi:hypothetical protein
MAESNDNSHPDLNRGPSKANASPGPSIGDERTEEQLQQDWDVLRGSNRGRNDPLAGRVNPWRELNSALWVTRIPQKVAAGASVAALLIAGWLLLFADSSLLRTSGKWEVAGLTLPAEMRLQKGGQFELAFDSSRFKTHLGEGLRGATTQVQEFQVRFNGETRSGEPISFDGVLLVTNAVGATTIHRKGDVLGAVLTGKWSVGGRITRTNSPPFIP